jgi:hypothetical protein
MDYYSLVWNARGDFSIYHAQSGSLAMAYRDSGTTSHTFEARETLLPNLAFSSTNCGSWANLISEKSLVLLSSQN